MSYAIRSAIAGAFRNPEQVESRFFAHLGQEGAASLPLPFRFAPPSLASSRASS